MLLRGSGTEAVSLSTRDSKADACEVDAEMCLEVVSIRSRYFLSSFRFLIYYFGLDIKRAALVLDHTRFGVWSSVVADCLVFVPGVLAFLQ